jgi:hypothetical protein
MKPDCVGAGIHFGALGFRNHDHDRHPVERGVIVSRPSLLQHVDDIAISHKGTYRVDPAKSGRI